MNTGRRVTQIPVVRQAEGNIGKQLSAEELFAKILDEVGKNDFEQKLVQKDTLQEIGSN